MVWTIDWAVFRFSEVTEMAAWMIWVELGFGGTRLDWTREGSQVSGQRVALQAEWISGGIAAMEGVGEGGLLMTCGGDELWRAAEERKTERKRERRVTERREAMKTRRNVEGLGKVTGCFMGLLFVVMLIQPVWRFRWL